MEGAPDVRIQAPKQGSGEDVLAKSRCGAQAPPDARRPRICWFGEQLDATGSVRGRIVPLGFLSRRAQKVIGPWGATRRRKRAMPSETTPAEAAEVKHPGIHKRAGPRERHPPRLGKLAPNEGAPLGPKPGGEARNG